jgi:hypothetical protein
MAINRAVHPTDEVLERFALGRLDEPEMGEFEEHLLTCAGCQDQLDEATEYVAVLRQACKNFLAAPEVESVWRKWMRVAWTPLRVPAMAGATLVVVAVLAWQPWLPPLVRGTQSVELRTMRGDAAGTTTKANVGLHLILDTSGLDVANASVQIVTEDGRQVFEGPLAFISGTAEVNHPGGLRPGQYWVRLKNSGETMREYSLRVLN